MRNKQTLPEILSAFSHMDCIPVVAAEIECYLPGADATLLTALTKAIRHEGIDLLDIEKERGEEQYELIFGCSFFIAKFAQQCERARRIVQEVVKAHGVTALFDAKPFIDRPGSGLHIHLHLEDHHGTKLFFREGEGYSNKMLWAVGGMLVTLKDNLDAFLPTPDSYARILHAKKETPSTVSWGNNNRTVAIRIPEAMGAQERRLEHRVAGADADMETVLTAILHGVHHGISHQLPPTIPQTFGDAYLDMYGLERIISL